MKEKITYGLIKGFKSIFLFLLLSFPFLVMAQDESWYQKGRDATEPGEIINFLTKSIEFEGESVCTYYYRGVAKFQLGDYNGAASDFSKAMTVKSKYQTAIQRRDDLSNNPEAQTNVYLHDKTDSSNTEQCRGLCYYYRGNSFYNLHNYNSAIEDYSKFIPLDIENHEYFNSRCTAYYLRSASYFYLKQYDLAFADISKYVSLKPKDPDGYNNLGLIYLIKGNYDEAIRQFKETIGINQNYASAYADIGYAYMQQGKTNLAVENFQHCLKIDTNTFSTYLDLSIIEYRKNNITQAKKYFEIAKSLEPDLSEGFEVISEFETEGFFWTQKDKETLKIIFNNLK